jgi:uncharacterized membrane protein
VRTYLDRAFWMAMFALALPILAAVVFLGLLCLTAVVLKGHWDNLWKGL